MFPNGRRPAQEVTALALDSFLDALSRQALPHHGGAPIEPTMAETARRVHAFGDADVESAPRPGILDSIWEDLMDLQPAVPSNRTSHTPSARAGATNDTNQRRQSFVTPLARMARFPFGEVAIAAVILLLLSTAFAAYRGSRPTSPDEPSEVPAAASLATPDAVAVIADPALCTFEPRTLAELDELMPTPGASNSRQDGSSPVPSHTTEPVTGDISAAVTDTLRGLYACVSGNDHLRAYAYFTDDALRRWFAHYGLLTPDQIINGPGTREAFQLLEVHPLEDGRIETTILFQMSEGKFRETWIFASVDERLLVDDIVRPDPLATSSASTPVAPIATPRR